MLFRVEIRMNEKHPISVTCVLFRQQATAPSQSQSSKHMLTKGSEKMRADDQSTLWLDTRSLSKADVVFDDCTKIHNHQCCRNV